jgi:hypothetical protein
VVRCLGREEGVSLSPYRLYSSGYSGSGISFFVACASWQAVVDQAGKKEVLLMAENVQMHVEGSILVIQVDLNQSFGLSASGKSELIASTGAMCRFLGMKRSKCDAMCTVLTDPITVGSGKRCLRIAGRRLA